MRSPVHSNAQTLQVNDATVNGSRDGLVLQDVYRASSPTNQGPMRVAREANRTMSVDILYPELAENSCVTFNQWEHQRCPVDIKTDYTDPLEMLSRL